MIPRKPGMHAELVERSEAALDRMTAESPGLRFKVYIDERHIAGRPGDCRPWSKVTRARNAMLDSMRPGLMAWADYLLWIDADVVEYPPEMATRLIEANPFGVSAPVVLIEGSKRFYDWAAYIIEGRDQIEPENRWNVLGRNLQHEPPYWPTEPATEIVAMDCVGTITMVPKWIYECGIRYIDHPAFTDHHPICEYARKRGQRVIAHRGIVAYHADLPRYGEAWH